MSDYSWASNPWVWCLTFRRVDEPPSGKPILFSGPMVRAILEGRKTQTRRVMNPQPHPEFLARGVVGVVPQWPLQDGVRWFMADGCSELVKCPYGKPGDRLWVRETWGIRDGRVLYRADLDRCAADTVDRLVQTWSPSIHMYKDNSRITLELTDVRVQRVQEISGADVAAEGCSLAWGDRQTLGSDEETARRLLFGQLWDSINGARQPKKRKATA